MPGMVKTAALLLLLLLASGCATTYVPISWGMGERVKALSASDPLLVVLFNRYDPDRKTLHVIGSSFDQVMMPSQVKYHLGAYRPDTKLIYRNMYQTYTDDQLRTLLLHELAHHVWHTGMTWQQREQWHNHLNENPSPLQEMVRRVYPYGSDWAGEDFAYTVEHARDVDLEALARITVITEKERDTLIAARLSEPPAPLRRKIVILNTQPGALNQAAPAGKGHYPAP